ncbi:Putative mycofactocin system creatinine amidohydrolase family protein MftE [Arenibacter antarcticus]|uniref:Creatininase family protein n=1 Tax=Arenibacter antarcticus TaxID=2040469 RepID=A0ABW5VFI4_9FLAO|nr:creatininase family protein [Arenibacter sp. H213]MCM4166550.1 amidase [Arenibacter sp. H213]
MKQQNIRPYVLSENNWKSVKEIAYQVAVLPWGATEAHNYHLPYATDNILAENIAVEAAKQAWENGSKVVVLPTIPFGVNTGQMDVKLCMNMSPSTQYAVLRDVVQVLNAHNIQKLVIVNGHGGNHFKQFIRELSLEFPKVFICSLNWWTSTDPKPYFNEPGDHAGELETSVVMHLTPEWVLNLQEAGSGAAKTFKIKGLKEGWVSSQRKWTQVTEDTGVGNPELSTAEKGKQFFEASAKTIGEFFKSLSQTDLNDMYE